MLRCIETIRFENNEMPLLGYHQQRFIYTQQCLWHRVYHASLKEIIDHAASQTIMDNGTKYKCRVLYGQQDVAVSFEPYKQTDIKELKIVRTDNIDYNFKYEDRTALNSLKNAMAKNIEMLVVKNHLLTDTSFTNIALLRNGRWYTPKRPLLQGVQRAFLLKNAYIFEKDIHEKDLCSFEKIKLFNAMVNWQEAWMLSISQIR